ncbi:anti-phage dCTP deaminase [Ruegeria atlantica]|uniref:anti-phage dCTP deaminase n=1 Tax=Ruegeria atlantica TaxID=81569 RepID=UPI0034610828
MNPITTWKAEILEKVADAELVVGIVGRMGVDTGAVYQWIAEVLHSLHYESHRIKITDFLKSRPFEDIELKEDPIEARYDSYIDACNHIREKAKRNDFFISYAVQRVIDIRLNGPAGTPDAPLPRTAYVIDQIKRPEEAKALRNIYGQQFVLISCHMPRDVRQHTLSAKIATGHASEPKAKEWQSVAHELIERDDKESSKRFGQRVSDVFPMADLIIDATSEDHATPTLKRFFEALFGNFAISPTRDEFFQNLAANVALTSCDTARQVGAAIANDGEVLATGFNEAPKAHGGTYWANEGLDGRDFAIGRDANTVRKRQMVTDIVRRLRDDGRLADNEITDAQIEAELIDGTDAPLKKSQIMDTLEYGRAVHAEMAALTTASRIGRSVYEATLYCTTFPCHNCSKHIVASGITRVFYLEPYGKSFTDELYPDSVLIDHSDKKKSVVSFQQFVGITPNRYRELFAKEKLKDAKGNIIPWRKASCQPVFEKLDQGHIAREVMFQKFLSENMDLDAKSYLGIPQ